MLNLSQLAIILSIVILIKNASSNSLVFKTRHQSIKANQTKNCHEVKCNLSIKCRRDEQLKLANSSMCCPTCVCNKCPVLDYNICSYGFKPIKQTKTDNECCDTITCISDPNNNDDLTLSIDEASEENTISQHKYHTFAPLISLSLKNPKANNKQPIISFNPSQKEILSSKEQQDNDYSINDNSFYANQDNESEHDIEIYMDNYQEPSINVIDKRCENINCSNEKYNYLKNSDKCPDDSTLIKLSEVEEKCCQVKHTCSCNVCDSKMKMIEWCKLAGTNFEAILVQKGEDVPGKCCDNHICHSANFTCDLNGVFHPHNSKWKLNTCTECKCEMGHIKCHQISCPILDCDLKSPLKTECCNVCTGECLSSSGKIIKPNETWTTDDDCTVCKCINGKKLCTAESCKPVTCKNPVKRPGVCCKICEENDVKPLSFLKYPPHCKAKLDVFKCNLTCKYSFKLDGNRCPLCQCSENAIEKCKFPCDTDLTFMPLSDRLCKCIDKCQNNKCNLVCKYGYKKSNDGCDRCECIEEEISPFAPCKNSQTGAIFNEGSIWFDGCRQCLCKNEKEYCSLISCKPLECSKPVYLKNNCCPICSEKNASLSTISNTTICFSPKSGDIYSDNEIWRLDKCTQCTCRNGIVLCENLECPPVACQNPVFDLYKDECCPYCPKDNKIAESQASVTTSVTENYWSCFDSNEQKRPHGTSWKESDCYHCTCFNGENKCFNYENKCPRLNCVRPILNKGHCCPYCLDSINSPYILSNEFINNITSFTPNSISNNSNSITYLIIYVLCALVLILFLLVIVLLIRSSQKIPNETASGRCTLLASSSLNDSKQNLKYSNENSITSLKKGSSSHKRYENFDKNPNEKIINSINYSNNRNNHEIETKDVNSPLLKNNVGVKNLINNNSDISDSFTNDDNSKSTLFTCSIDESNTKIPLSISKQNPISIYYC